MVIKNKIIEVISSIDNPIVLNELMNYLKRIVSKEEKNSDDKNFKNLIGVLPDDQAKEIMKNIDMEFNRIEGEW